MRTTLAVLGLVVIALGTAHAASVNDVAEWNDVAVTVLLAGGQNNLTLTRGLTMVSVAMHDALNAIQRRYEPYAFDSVGEPNATPEAAVATAARDVLVLAVPVFGTASQQATAIAMADTAYTAALARIADGPGKTSGIAVGRAAAAAIVGLRRDDGATRDVPYTPGTAPGQWRPHPNPVPADPPIPNPTLAPGYSAAMLPGWRYVTPFTLLSAAQFRPAGPPPLGSEAYTRDFNEVKSLGGKTSTARTAEQSQIARYWYEGSGQGWNRIARVVGAARKLDRWDLARLLALANMAIPQHAAHPGLSIDAQRPRRGGRGGAGRGPRQRSDRLHDGQRPAVRGHLTVVHELLGGRAGKRRFARVRGPPLSDGLSRRNRARPEDRHPRRSDVPPAEPTLRRLRAASQRPCRGRGCRPPGGSGEPPGQNAIAPESRVTTAAPTSRPARDRVPALRGISYADAPCPEEGTMRGDHSCAVVVGASMSGLLAARALSDRFERVTVVERDALKDGEEVRKGVPQAAHAHGLLASGYRVMDAYFPGMMDELEALGAPRGDVVGDFLWFQYGRWKLRHQSGLRGITVSRPCLEAAVRRRVKAIPHVRILEAADGLSPRLDEATGRVTGYVVRRRDSGMHETLDADLVVDATGRGSQAATWLERSGFGRPDEITVKVDVGYATRTFERRPGEFFDSVGGIISGTPPVGTRLAAVLAAEGRRWVVTLVGILGDHPPTNEREWVAFAASLPVSAVHELVTTALPLTDIVAYRFPANQRRLYERMKRFPSGYLVIGDAVCSFNPIYGQGMSVAAAEAQALGDAVKLGVDGLARRFYARARKIVDIPWTIATGEDLRFPQVEGPRPPGFRLVNRYLERVHAAASDDEVVCRRFFDVLNLLAPPASLMSPTLAGRVLARRAPRRDTSPWGVTPQRLGRSTSSRGPTLPET